MTILSATHSSRIRNRSMGVLHLIAADESCEVSDILALLVTTSNPSKTGVPEPFQRSETTTPSQPSPASQAPAARMSDPAPADVQAEGAAPQPSAIHSDIVQTISPEPQPTSTPAAQAGPDDVPVASAPVESVAAEISTPPIRPEVANETRGGLPVAAASVTAEETGRTPAYTRTGRDGTPHLSGVTGGESAATNIGEASFTDASKADTGKSVGEQSPAAPVTLRQRIIDCHTGHPDWPAKLIAEHVGTKPSSVRAYAAMERLSLPSQRDYDAAQFAHTTEALKAAPAQPQEPVERAGPPTPRSEAPPPPLATAAEPFDDDEPAPVVRKVMKAPTGRFYLRDKEGRFVHQSLQKCPTAPGPLMTSDRKWAWFDTMDRYRGAKKLWPELATMRKEALQ